MADEPSTREHQRPLQPDGGRRRPAFVCAFPVAIALPLPDSGAVVGRQWLASAGVMDTEVSGAHFLVDRAGGAPRVADAGSRNGTWVNGQRLPPAELVPLEDGSVVRVGKTVLVYREQLLGPLEPAPPVGGLLVGPHGLRGLAQPLQGLARSRPGNVLIEGETGVGKELAARAVAAALGRQSPYAAVNVAGLARGVFESHVFGHVAGAFSDARHASPGLVLAHDGGALFLDEIGELDLDLQAKLLRMLENREILPVGAQRPVRVDLVFLAATNRDLTRMVDEGTFRRDLYARLATARLTLPPLRARAEDIFWIACELERRAGAPLALADVEVEAVERLLLEPWPGNVRELGAALGALHQLDAGPGLRLWALEEALGGGAKAQPPVLTRAAVEAAVEAAGGNVTAAAEQLGVSRGKLLRLRKQGR